MDFKTITSRLEERLKLPLPGSIAHEKMRATPVGNLNPFFEHKSPPKPGSVLILFYPDDDRVCFPLTKRSDYLGTHGGQVSLPGGKREGTETEIETALRENEEEVGVPRQDIRVLGRLTNFFVIPSNFLVAPIVGMVDKKPKFVLEPVEVVRILKGDLEELVKDDAVQEKEILVARRFQMHAPYFEIDNEIVWGATAMMLNELRMIVREIL
jgi:8-oxo-dGTP pyrophosphatase MutT (NUDIX family)